MAGETFRIFSYTYRNMCFMEVFSYVKANRRCYFRRRSSEYEVSLVSGTTFLRDFPARNMMCLLWALQRKGDGSSTAGIGTASRTTPGWRATAAPSISPAIRPSADSSRKSRTARSRRSTWTSCSGAARKKRRGRHDSGAVPVQRHPVCGLQHAFLGGVHG